MRFLFKLLVIITIALSVISCHRNQLRLNEKRLSEEIILLEKLADVVEENDNILMIIK
jgi:hypothetical protein